MSPAGYSGTPLVKKLGYKPGTTARVIGAPNDYTRLVAPLPDGVRFLDRLSPSVQMVHIFTKRRSELKKQLERFRTKLDSAAVVWVSWPKKSSRVPTDVTEDVVREVALPLGWVDVKVCAVDETWSGLKLVVRKELR